MMITTSSKVGSSSMGLMQADQSHHGEMKLKKFTWKCKKKMIVSST